MAWIPGLLEILRRPKIGEVLSELVLFLGPLWFAVLLGVVLGWSWKPKWATTTFRRVPVLQLDSLTSEPSTSSLLSPAPSFSFGITSFIPFYYSCISCFFVDRKHKDAFSTIDSDSRSSKSVAVTGEDVEHLCQLVEVRDGGRAWIEMMACSTSTMSYQAWWRDPDQPGPPQYRTRTVFEDATPELVRDFFWDDESRSKWDDMLLYFETLEECPTTGTMVVRWIRKFPFFCSDREYIIGRRIWESGRSYYCVTKGVPYPSVTRRNRPRRVDQYYSSWCIRAVESMRGDGQLSACEVLLFHHEDMGIPREIAKLGIRQGMWGAVKKIEPGFRAYHKARATGAPLSRYVFMAQLNTKISADYLRSLETTSEISEVDQMPDPSDAKQMGTNIPKLLVVGGAVVLACSLDRGLLTKAVVFGVARSLAKIGRRL